MKTYLMTVMFALTFVNVQSLTSPYKVHLLETTNNVQVGLTSLDKNSIYCYQGPANKIERLLKTVKLHISVKEGTFQLYTGYSPEEVFSSYKINNYYSFSKSEIIDVSLFNTYCIFVDSTHSYQIQVSVKEIHAATQIIILGILFITIVKFSTFFINEICACVRNVTRMLNYVIGGRYLKQNIVIATIAFVLYRLYLTIATVKYEENLKQIVVFGLISFLMVPKFGLRAIQKISYVLMRAFQVAGFTAILVIALIFYNQRYI